MSRAEDGKEGKDVKDVVHDEAPAKKSNSDGRVFFGEPSFGWL